MTRRKRRDSEASLSADLRRSNSTRLIARAFSQQVFFRILGILANVLTITVTTRYLEPYSYGALTTAVVFVGLWTSLTELGIGSVVVRKVMSGKGSLERLVRINAGMSIVYSLPLFAIAVVSGFAVYNGKDDVIEMICIISITLLLTTVSSCFQPIFVATLRFTAVAVSDLLSRLGSLAFTMILIENDAKLQWFAVVQLIPAAIVLVTQGVAASRIVNCRPVFSLRESWQLLRESLPQTAVLIIGVLYWRADGVILSLRSTQDEVGVYGLAYTLAFTISVLPGFFGTSTLSAMTRLYATSRERFAKFVVGSVETMLFVGMPIALVGSICAAKIVGVVGSAGFVEKGGPTLALLLVAASVAFVTGILSQALFAAHDQIFLLRLNCVNLVINVLLNIFLTPKFGAVGAGIAMLITECVGLVVANWRLSALTQYRTPWRVTFRLLIPLAACSSFSGLERGLSVFVTIPAAAIIYFAVNLLVGPVTLTKLKALVDDSKQVGASTSAVDGGAEGLQ
jgi:O-antigen/teichoic acid export membrane protein